MEKSQREYYLNEQMKAIQKELGELDEAPSEMDELARRIEKAGMPKEVAAKARTELIAHLQEFRDELPERVTQGGPYIRKLRHQPVRDDDSDVDED